LEFNVPFQHKYGYIRDEQHCVRWGIQLPLKRGTLPPPLWPMSVVAKWSTISPTTEHLLWPPYGIWHAIIFLSCDFFFFLSFFLTYSQLLQPGCLPYLHTWCGSSVNLGCRSETCCTWLAANAGQKQSPKIRHLCTIAQLCPAISLQLRHTLTIRKKLLNSNISFTCPIICWTSAH